MTRLLVLQQLLNLSGRQIAFHIAGSQARIEHVFARLAQMGGQMVRSIGLVLAEFGLVIKSASPTSLGCRACWKWLEPGRRLRIATGLAGTYPAARMPGAALAALGHAFLEVS